ncbi:NAD(P)/FAD-dependent oxidoreductase [Marinobacter oulmenensis]|uniref:Amine oxidase domain-containing protein n=1 Tax=Marinobacter oulmenensis TaxID=643747 RepID=A0A840U631_9GAMM|nr:FAD-dependent oxidoreductase [Marinobacter oulmenensis]MBB5320589.1 hypothetical protein [Marinobacter oulmenensis]
MPKLGSNTSHLRSIAVIGSGLAGLVSAILLQDQGHRVTVFEKSRGPGGRLSAKRVGEGESADIGAQYFTIRDPGFRYFLNRWAGETAFDVWNGEFGFQQPDKRWEAFPDEQRYVGVPRMTAISRALSGHVTVHANTRIGLLASAGERWQLRCTEGRDQGEYDQVIITAPPAQAHHLLADSGLTGLGDQVVDAAGDMLPCWAAAVQLTDPVPCRYQGMRPDSEILFWVANNTSKPGRTGHQGEWWVLHATPEWTNRHLQTPAGEIPALLFEAFRDLTGYRGKSSDSQAHRWLYARSVQGHNPGYLLAAEQGVGLAGDWLAGGRVEGAWSSARSLVEAMTGAG